MRFSLDNAGLNGWQVHDLKIDNAGCVLLG
jgi:hypothetical protein